MPQPHASTHLTDEQLGWKPLRKNTSICKPITKLIMILIQSDTHLPLTDNKRLLTTCLKNQKIQTGNASTNCNLATFRDQVHGRSRCRVANAPVIGLIFRVLRSLCYCNVASHQYHEYSIYFYICLFMGLRIIIS